MKVRDLIDCLEDFNQGHVRYRKVRYSKGI